MADKDFIVKNGLVTGANNVTFGSAVTFASNGNVGIANTTPADKLVVTGSITATANVSAASVNASTGFYGTVQTATQGTVNHNSLANYVADQHVAHGGVSISAGNGLTGGGTIAATRTLSVSPGNTQLIANSTGLWANQAQFDHNTLTNYVADQHVAHGGVSITAGNGLSGGGTIAASRSLAVVANTGIVSNATGVYVSNVPTAVTFNNGGAGGASGSTFNGNSAVTVSYNTIGAPSTTGTGASGTWGISITGSAASATNATNANNASYLGGTISSGYALLSGATFTGDIITYRAAAPTTGVIFLGNAGSRYLYFDGTNYQMPSSELYVNGVQVVKNSGTWGINITGSAASATSATSATTFTSTSQNSQFNSIGVGTAASAVAGEIRANNNITAYYSSDARLKENVKNIVNPLDKISKINGVEFDWTDDYIERHGGEDGYFIRKHDVGVIAQEIEAVLPEVVATREDGFKAVKYDRIVALLIESIKELKEELDELKSKNQ